MDKAKGGRPKKDTEFVEKKSRKEVMAMSEEEKKAYKQARNRQTQRAYQEKKAKVVPVVKTQAARTLQAVVRRKLNPDVEAGQIPVILPVPVPMPVSVGTKKKLDKLEKVQAKAKELLAKRELGKKNESAIKIQTAFRAKKAKKDVKDMLDSVKQLQAVFARKPMMDIMLPNIRAEVQRKKYEEGYAKRMAAKAQNK
jgi:hypothetical protein